MERLYDPPPGPPPGWIPPQQLYHPPPGPPPGWYFPPRNDPHLQPPHYHPPAGGNAAPGLPGQYAAVPGYIQVQQAARHYNPTANSIGPAGARDIDRYSQARHGHLDQPHYGPAPPPAGPPPALPPPSRLAPRLPADVIAAIGDPNKNKKFRNAIRMTNPKDQERMAEIEAQSAIIHDRENPFTRKHRRGILATWSITLMEKYPDLPTEDHWASHIVLKEAKPYLRWRVERSPGRNGAQHVKAITLKNWMTHLVHCIVKYAHDSETQERAGMVLLIQHHLLEQLDQEVAQIIDDYKLDRFQNDKLYLGRWELKIMVQQLLDNMTPDNLVVNLQRWVEIELIFYATSRGSSIAATHELYASQEKYLKLGHFKITAVAKYSWHVSVDLRNFKAYNDAVSRRQFLELAPVLFAHNVIFDFGLWLVMYLFYRGAFKYKTWLELLESDDAELVILESKREEPFSLKARPRGLGLFMDPPVPGTAHAISDFIRNLAKSAGLPGGNCGALRRDAGNDYGLQCGKEWALLLMNHRESATTFNQYYSKGCGNMPLVSIRLLEFDVESAHVKAGMAMAEFSSCAVLAMVTKLARNLKTQNVADERRHQVVKKRQAIVALSTEDDEEIEARTDITHINNLVDTAWSTFRGLFANGLKKYPKNILQNIKNMTAQANERTADATKEEETKAIDNIRALAGQREKLYRKVRKARRAAKSKEEPDVLVASGQDTIDNRQKAIEVLRKPINVYKHLDAGSSKAGPSRTTMELDTISSPPSPTNEEVEKPRESLSANAQPFESYIDRHTLGAPSPIPGLESDSIPSPDELARWADHLGLQCPPDEGDTDEEEELARTFRVSTRLEITQAKSIAKKTATKASIPASSAPAAPTANPEASDASSWLFGNTDSLPPTSDDDEKYEYDILKLPAAMVRRDMLLYIVGPYEEHRAATAQFKADGDRWVCQLCEPHTIYSSGDATTIYVAPDLDKLRRHIKQVHTAWYELRLTMWNPEGSEARPWRCAHSGCSYRGKKVHDTTNHMLKSCMNKEEFAMIMKESSGRSPRAGAVRRGRLGASSSGSESESDSATSDEVLASLNAFRKLSTQDLFDQAAKHDIPHPEHLRPYIQTLLDIVADGLDAGVTTSDDFLRTLKSGVPPGAWDSLS